MDVWLGKTFGKYQVKKFIGKGTIGSVYQAEHIESKKIFAIKIFDLRLSHSLRQKLHLLDEAKTLQHDNIVKIYERGESHSTFYMIMEYIEGKSLYALIEEKKRLSSRHVLSIAKGIAKALVYSHKQGIVHRDIKPTNIIITKDQKIKITDFGMAKIVNSVSDISQLDKIISTVFYVSPEQAMGVKKIDSRTDFYSLGITLYQALTGQIPYPGRTPLQVLQQHISSPLPKMNKLHSDIPLEMEKIVVKLTAKKREERYQTAEQVLEAIAVCNTKITRRKETFSALPTWAVSGLVFFVLFFVSFTLAKKMLKAPENQQKETQFSIEKIEIQNSLQQDKDNFSKDSMMCLEIYWSVTYLSQKELSKIFTIVFEGRNLNPITQNLGEAQIGQQYHKYCVSLHNFAYGSHTVRAGFIIGNIVRQKQVSFTIPPPVKKVRHIQITPKKITLVPQSLYKFSYQLTDENNDVVKTTKPIRWTVDNGSIDNGVYTAGQNEGTFRVTVSCPSYNIKDSAIVVVEKNKDSKRSGWFGERMPKGMVKASTRGEYIWQKDQSVMAFVPAGKFWLGSNYQENEMPVQQVYLDSFYVDKYEVSQKQYRNFCKATKRKCPPQPKWSSPDHPIVNISWQEAQKYARWAQKRLPSEREWEKVAKGGFYIPDWKTDKASIPLMLNPRPRRAYPWGDQLPNEHGIYRCNYVSNNKWGERHLDGYKRGAPVFAFSRWKSPYGCVNLSGNVWEWCADLYRDNHSSKPHKKPHTKYVVRGGSWYNHSKGCRTTRRHHGLVNQKSEFIGIRFCKSAQ
ncbi:bifunctional serine/threonine-protein kinase/formylglycine-generating enzyme family protein [Candidatus Uabimicrobium amorphum]|uniref:non-specific serine/threonine protein kinase n=1 Tax=Uabimicrobium amorphum TaxID=2596890 RepID=A0A5S9IR71_UABAM|nr:bifunctional serine/threonine-protein kinase/formylglycine-generating enzyme family protein [Candidatus Uabimicrobium amorphum]BBM85670.1 putative serine/threonine-protein kinase [Candidatus Uabimicrobium amorphum]